jgi:ATP-binding cassette subfamily B protein
VSEPVDLKTRIRTALRLDRAVRLVWNAAPRLTLLNAGLVFIQGILAPLGLLLTRQVLNTVTAGLATLDPSTAFRPTLIWIALAAAVALAAAFTRLLSEYSSEALAMQVTDSVADLIHARSIAMDLDYYEDSLNHDALHRAQKEAPWRPPRIVNSLIQIGQSAVSLTGVALLLIGLGWGLALLLAAAAIPGAVVRVFYSRRLYGLDQEQAAKERRAWYYHLLLTDASYAKEVRQFNLGDLFRRRFRDLRGDIRLSRLALARRRMTLDLLAQLISNGVLFAAFAWVVYRALLGAVSLGDLMVYFLGFQAGLGYMQAILSALAGLYEDNLFLSTFYRFMDLEPRIVAPPVPIHVPRPMQGGVIFRRVGFAYPGREAQALQEIDLEIKPGQVIALVGENGSGKSTLVKLLCRLYDPQGGSISVDGIDLRQFDPAEWRARLSLVFQDYVHYSMRAWENIWMGQPEADPDRQRIRVAARKAGADGLVESLPQGYETMLGRIFEQGQDLSAGEWQKMALARLFYRQAEIVVLDEPSAALDPLAEADLFRRFRELIEGRAAVLISHRFSTVQMADCIYVLERGRIVERGSHAELLARNGQYARMYLAQAQNYRASIEP